MSSQAPGGCAGRSRPGLPGWTAAEVPSPAPGPTLHVSELQGFRCQRGPKLCSHIQARGETLQGQGSLPAQLALGTGRNIAGDVGTGLAGLEPVLSAQGYTGASVHSGPSAR